MFAGEDFDPKVVRIAAYFVCTLYYFVSLG
jgi:hypothetical protein